MIKKNKKKTFFTLKLFVFENLAEGEIKIFLALHKWGQLISEENRLMPYDNVPLAWFDIILHWNILYDFLVYVISFSQR